MNIRSEQLIHLSQKIVEELAIPNIRYATVGGSVARGEADQYSDIDLNIYVSNGPTYDDIFVYEGEIIQLFVTDELPSEQQINENPWEKRFLRESVSIYDPTKEFSILKEYATTFFKSKEGKELLARQAIDIVSVRKQSAMDSLITAYGLPQEWNNNGKNGPERYIEVQIWDDEVISKYL